MRKRDIAAQRNAKQAQRQPQDLDTYEDEQDIEHMYARDQFEHEQDRAQEGRQQ